MHVWILGLQEGEYHSMGMLDNEVLCVSVRGKDIHGRSHVDQTGVLWSSRFCAWLAWRPTKTSPLSTRITTAVSEYGLPPKQIPCCDSIAYYTLSAVS